MLVPNYMDRDTQVNRAHHQSITQWLSQEGITAA
jgi:hypothetical protein